MYYLYHASTMEKVFHCDHLREKTMSIKVRSFCKIESHVHTAM